MPYCLGWGPHCAGNRVEVSVEKLHFGSLRTHNKPFIQLQKKPSMFFSPPLRTEGVLCFVHWWDGHSHSEGFLWWRTDKNQRVWGCIPCSGPLRQTGVTKRGLLHVICLLLSQVSSSAWNKAAQYTGTTVSAPLSPDSHRGNGYFLCFCMRRCLRQVLFGVFHTITAPQRLVEIVCTTNIKYDALLKRLFSFYGRGRHIKFDLSLHVFRPDLGYRGVKDVSDVSRRRFVSLAEGQRVGLHSTLHSLSLCPGQSRQQHGVVYILAVLADEVGQASVGQPLLLLFAFWGTRIQNVSVINFQDGCCTLRTELHNKNTETQPLYKAKL